MAKSKNHTSKNQNSKAHRNGIKRPQKFSFKRLTGRHQPFVKNCRKAIRFDPMQNKLLMAKIIADKSGQDYNKLVVLKKKQLIAHARSKKIEIKKQ